MNKSLMLSALALVSALVIGCSSADGDRVKVHPVEGQLRVNGKPVAGALVALHPKNPSDPRALPARGRTDEAGNFKISTYDSDDGAATGEYAVTVVHFPIIPDGSGAKAGPNDLPLKYEKPDTTDVSVRVAEGPNKLAPIDLR